MPSQNVRTTLLPTPCTTTVAPTPSKSVVEVSDSPVKSSPEMWRPSLLLYHCDRRILESKTDWLNDRIIQAAQMLLQRQSEDIYGWNHPLCSQRNALFPPIPRNSKFIQLMNINGNHWICVSNVAQSDTLRNCARVYDSTLETINAETKKAICSLLKPKEDVFHFDLADVQKQSNSSDCGLFAVAFATELVYGGSPCSCIFDVTVLRSHLLECLEKGFLTSFPSKAKRVGFGKIVKWSSRDAINCTCRMVEDSLRPMIQCRSCKKLFHFDCADIVSCDSVNRANWMCDICKHVFLH